MSAYVYDSFNRANGGIGGFWSTPAQPSGGVGTGSIQLLSDAFTASVGACNQCQSVVTGYSFGNDQWAQLTIAATPINKSTFSVSACSSSGGTSVYTYTLTAGVALFVGQQVYLSGMKNSGNDSTVGFIITALGTGTFSVSNATPGADETGSSGIGIGPGDAWVGLVVRGTADGNNGYFAYFGLNSGAFGNNGSSTDQRVYTIELWKNVSGTLTFLQGRGTLTSIGDVAGTVYRLSAVGTTITIYRNGVNIISVTDADLTAGSPGIQASSNTGVGEFAAPTSYTDATYDTTMQAKDFYAADYPFIGQSASDAFQRAAAGSPPYLGSNWTDISTPSGTNPPTIVSDMVQGTVADVNNDAIYSAASWADDQYSEVTILALGNANSYGGAIVRASNVNCYEAFMTPIEAALVKIVAGTQSALPSYSVGSEVTSTTWTAGDILRIAVSGSTVSVYQNGYLLIQGTDTDITSGTPGLLSQPNSSLANSKITLWAGGNPNVIPTYPAGGFQNAPPFGAGSTGTLGEAASPSAASNRTSEFGTGRTEIIG